MPHGRFFTDWDKCASLLLLHYSSQTVEVIEKANQRAKKEQRQMQNLFMIDIFWSLLFSSTSLSAGLQKKMGLTCCDTIPPAENLVIGGSLAGVPHWAKNFVKKKLICIKVHVP